MGWEFDLRIGIVELAHLLVTVVLAYLVSEIGWRFTNIRAAKDLVIEEGRRSLHVCEKIRKSLRTVPDLEIPKHEDFSEYLDDLGDYLDNCLRLYNGISNGSESRNTDTLNNDFFLLRVALSGDKNKRDQDAQYALSQLRNVRKAIIALMLEINR